MRYSSNPMGFTLAEVLISLALLGVVAAFTVPKIMQAQADSALDATMKETMSEVLNVYLQQKNGSTAVTNVVPSTGINNLGFLQSSFTGPMMNKFYVDHISSNNSGGGVMLGVGDVFPHECKPLGSFDCFRMHNGTNVGILAESLEGNAAHPEYNKAHVRIVIDADGVNNLKNAMLLRFYASGRIQNQAQYCLSTGGTVASCATYIGVTPSWYTQ